MRILLVHNFYRQPGGEDQVFRAEGELLESHGHVVLRYSEDNRRTSDLGQLGLAGRAIWSRETYRNVRDLLRRERPDLIHVHNTLPLISPAVYYAAQAEDIPVVQTLHNYRLQCLPGDFFRQGRICEDCLGKSVPWPGVLHACYRESRAASGTVATMLAIHRALGTYANKVDLYIALTEFGRSKLVAGGLPSEKVMVKPHFVEVDPGWGDALGEHALFVGRLSEPKGIRTLIAAWKKLEKEMPLVVVGDGPLSSEVARAARTLSGVEFLGWQERNVVLQFMKNAKVLVFPSLWYEGLPLVILEAFATGLPVVASDRGAMAEVIDHGRTGLLFKAGEAEDLANSIRWAQNHPEKLQAMRRAARKEYENRYTAEKNYEMLANVYRQIIDRRTRPDSPLEVISILPD